MADLIDRQVAIKAIEDLPNCYNGFSDTYDKSCIIGVIEELPSAQSKRVGVWWFEEYPDGYYHAECSECGQWFEEDAYLKPFKFCPNCGCAMKGEEDD